MYVYFNAMPLPSASTYCYIYDDLRDRRVLNYNEWCSDFYYFISKAMIDLIWDRRGGSNFAFFLLQDGVNHWST